MSVKSKGTVFVAGAATSCGGDDDRIAVTSTSSRNRFDDLTDKSIGSFCTLSSATLKLLPPCLASGLEAVREICGNDSINSSGMFGARDDIDGDSE